eukprot:gnl/MRDRNA2_/MRDRNA2_30663_c0_seq1.p1 gnl/MRDRNA2_/MRDRNA2_30663_c0~~gnl/MRDRNA2_/MRDRNA2_30663_c0_seq1.p1  ORF type:complete len:128 (+),score=1.47 gnl/MRDRNA2_/MRDRNA2_30663_c0_seq1:310-693(+)
MLMSVEATALSLVQQMRFVSSSFGDWPNAGSNGCCSTNQACDGTAERPCPPTDAWLANATESIFKNNCELQRKGGCRVSRMRMNERKTSTPNECKNIIMRLWGQSCANRRRGVESHLVCICRCLLQT